MLTIGNLLQAGEQIYVRNHAGKHLGTVSPYFLQLRSISGERLQIMVPATKHPFCLSSKAPAHLLQESVDLQRALNKGILELLDPQNARAILSDPHAQRAVAIAESKYQSRVRAQPQGTADFKVRHSSEGSSHVEYHGANIMVEGPELVDADVLVEGDQNAVTMTTAAPNDKGKASPKVIQLVLDLKKDPELKEEVQFGLEEMEEALTEEDLQYCIKELQEFKAVVAWCKGELAKRRGDANPTTQRSRRKRRK